MTDWAPYFAGQKLWGDQLSESERLAWFRDEEDAYVELTAGDPEYEYSYDTTNQLNGFRWLPSDRIFNKALGLGSAYGDEMKPIASRIRAAVVVESSDHYEAKQGTPFPLEWRKALPSGDLPLSDNEVDLAVCLGVLHHIPNVTYVLRELGRVVESGGFALIREPIISMGDWRLPRQGLTPRERGIPRKLLIRACQDAGFQVEKERLCFFPGTPILGRWLRRHPFQDPSMVRLDAALSRLTLGNYRYHSTTALTKVRPTSSFLTLRRL
jgi:SAM-dependent methyltransferase